MKFPLAAFLVATWAGLSWGQAADRSYYPLKEGNQWTYQVGNKTVVIKVARTTTVEYLAHKPDPKDIDKKKGREEKVTATGYVLESTGRGGPPQVETVAVLADGVYRFAAMGKDIAPPLCFFKFPAQPGNSWSFHALVDGQPLQGQFICQEEVIKVPAFKEQVKALKVFSKDFQHGKQKMAIASWFIPQIGLVKQQVQLGGYTIDMDLQSYQLK